MATGLGNVRHKELPQLQAELLLLRLAEADQILVAPDIFQYTQSIHNLPIIFFFASLAEGFRECT